MGELRTFQNPPVIHRPEENDQEYPLVNPDPYVIKYKGMYYSYATGAQGVTVMASGDLCEWQHLGYALRLPDQKDYWAPAVYYHNGLFYMYYSSMKPDEHDPHFEIMKVAVSEAPEGPFRYVKTLFDTFSIDAHVVRRDGEFYLFYSTNDYAGTDEDHPGTVILVDRLLDLYTPAGEPQIVVKPTLQEEVFEENRFGDGRDWHTIEGAFYLERHGKHYCMYSGNAYLKPHYFIGYSIADTITGPWTKAPNEYTYAPLMKKTEHVLGTGHNSVIQAPNLIDDWIVYHGVDAGKVHEMHREHRQLRIDPLFWKGEHMWTPGPSHDLQAAPALPTVQGLDNGLWEENGGAWETADGELRQTSPAGKAEWLLREPVNSYVCEVSAKWNPPVPSHLGGLYGLYLAYQNEANYVQLLFHTGRHEFQVLAAVNGIRSELHRGRLEKGFRWDVWHCIRVERNLSHAAVWVDGQELLRASVPVPSGRVGFVTHSTSASYAGFALTKQVSLMPGSLPLFEASGDWSLLGRKLSYEKDGRLGMVVMKEPFGTGYQCSVDVKTNSQYKGRLGIYISYLNQDNYVRVSFDEAKRRVCIQWIEDGTVRQSEEADYPPLLSFGDGHTLLVKAGGGQAVVLADDMLIFDGDVSTCEAGIGLFAEMKTEFRHLQVWTLN
ncbi:family 43 glycosylhydrolase [Ectobacillus ponti]|uniref:Family 43 glycosylhydrolase n=1 Tax=Ectobacillus ponti TaxID=2961894 RepID=A0AA41X7Z4_9BACI|nr:family 43 glycosylhydrolase [Ectobacillus ponti]MCP8967958.1 family 43 glycosylhydrolase [Ectobacillus ponti]